MNKNKLSLEEATIKAIYDQLPTDNSELTSVDGIVDDILVITDPEVTSDEYDEVIDRAQELVNDTPEGDIPLDTDYLDDFVQTCPICGATFAEDHMLQPGDVCPVCLDTPEAFILKGKIAADEDVAEEEGIETPESEEETDDTVDTDTTLDDNTDQEQEENTDTDKEEDKLEASEQVKESDDKLEESIKLEESSNIDNIIDDFTHDHDNAFKYQMLDRLKMDCDYFLGNGNRYEKHLWAQNVPDQIKLMRALYDSFEDDKKPEWLTKQDIDNYEKEMTTENMTETKSSITDVKADEIIKQYFNGDFDLTELHSKLEKYFGSKAKAAKYLIAREGEISKPAKVEEAKITDYISQEELENLIKANDIFGFVEDIEVLDNMLIRVKNESGDSFYKIIKNDDGQYEAYLTDEDGKSAAKRFILKESLEQDEEDGWGEDIQDICEPFFEKCEDIINEVRNCKRGYGVNIGDNVTGLVEYFDKLQQLLQEVTNELDSSEQQLQENKNLKENKSSLEGIVKSNITNKIPDEINYNNKSYKSMNIMDNSLPANQSKVLFYVGDNADESDDYFYVTVELTKQDEDNYNGVNKVLDVEDFTSDDTLAETSNSEINAAKEDAKSKGLYCENVEGTESNKDNLVELVKTYKKKLATIDTEEDLEDLVDEIHEAVEEKSETNWAAEDLYSAMEGALDDSDASSRGPVVYIKSVKRFINNALKDFINDYEDACNDEELDENKKVTDDKEKVYGKNTNIKVQEDKENTYYYEIHFKFNEDDEEPEGYSKFFKANKKVTDKEDIIELAKQYDELDEDDLADIDYIDYATEINREEYEKAQ